MTTTHRSDVVVIGGGPAGSTVSSFLAMQGHDVTVLERAIFPRDHVGESLLPFCYGIFDELGVLQEMSERYVRKPGVRFLDTDDTTSTTYCFHHKIDGPHALSFQVLRSEFDEMLLQNSERLGVTVHQGFKAENVDLEVGDGVAVDAIDRDGARHRFEARFVIDASGRETFLANRMNTKTAHKELARTALSSHWSGAKYEGGLQEGMIQIVYTGGEKQGWIWVIPLGNDRLSVGVVMNTAYFRAQRTAIRERGIKEWQQALYDQELAEPAFTRHILEGATQMWPIQYNGDYSYFCHEKWGERFALVGDASAFIDPIFSSGVYLAMNSGRLLARAVHVRLEKGEDAGAQAMEDTYEQILGAYGLVDTLIRLFYTPDAINYAQLGTAADAFEDYDHYANAMSLQHFLLAGDFFEQSNKYREFLTKFRDPKMFRKYKSFVIDRDDFRAFKSCDMPHDKIFNPKLAEWERVRAERGI